MNIVVINNLPRFPGTPRWDFDLVRYEDFIDHRAHRVSYLVNARGRSGVTAPSGSLRLFELQRLDDVAACARVLEDIEREDGPIDRLIVFSESLQDTAAQLRQRLGIPGKRPQENRLGRDKLLMKQRVAAAGLRAPRYTAVTAGQVEHALAFAREAGYPLILKPINGQSSQGVHKLMEEAQLRTAVAALPPVSLWDLEEYVEGALLHVDGLIDADGRVRMVVPSRYLNTCLDFTLGAPLGAIMLAPGSALHERVCGFATQCLQAIGLKACPFHLELFHTEVDELVFLEVGARVGGADVPSMIHRATGVNLFAEWVHMCLGEPPKARAPRALAPKSIGAWLMFPRPEGLPRRVQAVTRFDGCLRSLYRQLVPEVGQLMEHEDGYCSLQSGRFLFDADSADQVARDVQYVLDMFSLTTAPQH
jgi:hypothetical protein